MPGYVLQKSAEVNFKLNLVFLGEAVLPVGQFCNFFLNILIDFKSVCNNCAPAWPNEACFVMHE